MDETYEKRGYLTEDFRLFHLRDDRGTKVDYHYHEFHKLVFLLEGTGNYVVEGRRYLLKPGDIVLVGSRCVHKPEFESGISYERIILYIAPSFLFANSTESCRLEEIFSGEKGHVLRPDETVLRRFRSELCSLEQEMSGDDYGSDLLARFLLLRLILTIGREWRRRDTQLPCPIVPKDSKVLDILRYLDTNLTEEININSLAARFYISKYHMMRRFREETGTSIHNYLSGKRLLRAREMIQSGVKATDACYKAGFSSYSAFSRAYAKLFGVSPTGKRSEALSADELLE